MKTIQCRALKAFTQFIAGYGQVHGDPGSSDEKARLPMVPEDAVAMLIEAGKIEVEGLAITTSAFTMTAIPGGRFKVEGPGIEPAKIIKGKANAEQYLMMAEQAHLQAEMLASMSSTPNLAPPI
ncbi:hypothetical protein [Sphingobium sp. HDIP04]|uniref:hypothetical protein n=1 Tax=Sphingobium sp. HDIP04 TaxID=428994 RepID=UPI0003877194|nr:hypothetical protein [Sphingobium sp. HDIP04]EQA97282.1 hypothetical protein L286_23440 [Sphingobium sp. HDIP04]